LGVRKAGKGLFEKKSAKIPKKHEETRRNTKKHEETRRNTKKHEEKSKKGPTLFSLCCPLGIFGHFVKRSA
jgi:hypothetical protein